MYHLSLYSESKLGYSGNGDFGFETVSLSWQGSGGPTLTNQVVGGIATKDFYIGRLPLTPRPVNFTDLNHPNPSVLETLKSQSIVPSLSWAYTAGAPYRQKKPFGSLVFGGYDSTKFVANNMWFDFGADISYDLLVGVQAITSDGEALLPIGIISFLNSNVPHIWLPVESCKRFESLYGLSLDNSTDLYLVNDTLHEALLSKNASITFTLGKTGDGGETIDIVLPYASFDLTVNLESTNTTSRYFPIRQAQNDSQYTIGRTFLQEA